jgi:TonB-linked SusC/RagA family outer membrane protein
MRKREKLGTWSRAFLLLSILCFVTVFAKAQTVTGVVKDQNGDAVIGATVKVVGSKAGTVTDSKGHYSINAPEGSVLSVSYIGFLTKQMRLRGENVVDITLQEDNTTLNDLVVVGYGTQKKKLVTGATVQVSGESIAKLNTSNALGAMAGSTPGVQIRQSSSQPGKGFDVVIRGKGTINSYEPLYVIDGVAGGDISNINPNDIESIDVLKDAASAAIFGAQGANGVILVTTKQGKAGKVELTYNGSMGWSNSYKRPQLLDAKQYMAIIDEYTFNTSGKKLEWEGWVPADILQKVADGWTGTDWWDVFMNKNAKQQNHALTLTGGSDKSKFLMSYTYTDNKGIMGGDVASYYNRHTMRVNSDHVLLKAKDFDAITIGENVSINYNKSHDLAEDGMYWSYIHSLLQTSPLMPQWADEEKGIIYNNASYGTGWNDVLFSNPYENLTKGGFNSMAESRNLNVNATAFMTIQPIKGLRWRTQYSYIWGAGAYRNYSVPRSPTPGTGIVKEYAASQNTWMNTSSYIENTLTYDLPIFSGHKISVMAGQSFKSTGWSVKLGGSNKVSEGDQLATLKGWNSAYLSNFKVNSVSAVTLTGEPNQDDEYLASWFGRLNWDFNETYMATFTLRTDGSSIFTKGQRWGTFPSASAGWVVSNENFMKGAQSWMDFFKIRASWGQNGNCNVPKYQGIATIAQSGANGDTGYKFADDMASTVNGVPNVGAFTDIVPNPDLTWETSEQIDLGFDARFLNSRLGLNFDWYRKTTKDWLVKGDQKYSDGTGPAFYNKGDVRNTGIELAVTWNDKIGSDFSYNVGVNFATNKNEVIRIVNQNGYINGDYSVLSQGTDYVSRVEIGHAIGYFYGMSYSGIWQNQAEIEAARQAGKAVLDGAQPGDCIWDDWNGDGIITYADDPATTDRHEIGDPNPDMTLGVNLGFNWKGLDFAVSGYGQFGQQVMRSYRSFSDNPYQNYDTTILNRWHGEGTSNDTPRISGTGHSNTNWVSTRYMEDADFFKIQSVTLGYDFKQLWKSCPLQQLRFYVQAQNLYTFTGYTGLDPEVGSRGGSANKWVSGIDLGLYPSARTFTVGASIKF